MPIYEYRCPDGHLTQIVDRIAAEKPASIPCREFLGTQPCEDDPEAVEPVCCGLDAPRVWAPPAAIHYKGAGTYTTDYKHKYDRKRRKNAGDDLPLPSEAAITRAEGAEYDPPKHLPGGVIPRTAEKKVSVAI